MKKAKSFSLFFVFVLSFFFSMNIVNAFVTKTDSISNTFSFAPTHTNTYRYILQYVNGTTEVLGEQTISYFEGETVTLDQPNVSVTGYTLDNITINGSGNYNIGYSFTQSTTDNTIVYTYLAPARTFTVRYTGDTNTFSQNGGTSATEGNTYTSKISPNNNYSIDTVTVTMNNVTLTRNTDYTLDNSGNLSILNVSGNITIDVQTSGGCLAEGTMLMLWDGSTKPIEDIGYTDLLKVWNHDLGRYGYAYPTYIEKEGTASRYTKVTFSDGTELRIIYDHRVFSKTLNKYVNINSDELNVGDEVVSLQDGLHYVTVESIEEIEEPVKFYSVITARYFNNIANGLLTSYEIKDDVSSNYKGFKDDELIWKNYTPEDRLISYEDVVNTFGYVDKYLYKNLKLEDLQYAVEEGFITEEALILIVDKFMMDDDYRLSPPVNENGTRLWIVATSDDIDPSDLSLQLEEGSSYEIPVPNNEENFLHWYNSSDNKYYQPGDIIEVDSNIYLEAIYE